MAKRKIFVVERKSKKVTTPEQTTRFTGGHTYFEPSDVSFSILLM